MARAAGQWAGRLQEEKPFCELSHQAESSQSTEGIPAWKSSWKAGLTMLQHGQSPPFCMSSSLGIALFKAPAALELRGRSNSACVLPDLSLLI